MAELSKGVAHVGYLKLDKQITVPFGPGNTRTLLPGINPNISREESEHWYVRAAGGQYFEELSEAHRHAPGAREAVERARATWQQSVRAAMAAQESMLALRRDLEKMESDMGLDTEARDKEFEDSIKSERDRLQALADETLDRAEAQASADAEGHLSPAQAERKAAGSEEVANTAMNGPAADDAAQQTGKVDSTQQLPRTAPDGPLGASPTEAAAAGSDEAANTKPSGEPRVDDQRQDPSQKDAGKAADVTQGGAKSADGDPKDPVSTPSTATGTAKSADDKKADESRDAGKDAPKADDKKK